MYWERCTSAKIEGDFGSSLAESCQDDTGVTRQMKWKDVVEDRHPLADIFHMTVPELKAHLKGKNQPDTGTKVCNVIIMDGVLFLDSPLKG